MSSIKTSCAGDFRDSIHEPVIMKCSLHLSRNRPPWHALGCFFTKYFLIFVDDIFVHTISRSTRVVYDLVSNSVCDAFEICLFFFSIYCIQWTSWIKLCSLTVKTNQQKISRNRIKTNCCPSNNQLRQVFIILQWTLHSRTFYTCIYANFLDADLFSKLLKIKLCL